MRKNGKLDECEKAKMESAFNFVCGRVRLLKTNYSYSYMVARKKVF